MLKIHMFKPEGVLGNLSYLIENREKQTAFVVDPSNGTTIYSYLMEREIELLGIINTHNHRDHTEGNSFLLSQYSELPVYFDVVDNFEF